MSQLRIGFAGIAGHSGIILEGVKRLPDAKIVAIAPEPEGRGMVDAFRQREPVPADVKIYKSYRQMLSREKLDIVGVFGIDGTRARVLRDCAAAGVHICTEKPLAMNLRQLAGVREAVAKAGVHLTTLLTMRNEPIYAAARRVVREGLIGEVAQISAQKSYKLGQRPPWMTSRKTFSGAIPFVGIHMFDLMRWTSGREFVEVAAFHANTTQPQIAEMQDNASVLFRMDNGGSATIRIDYLRPAAAPTHGDDRLRLAGGKGVVEARGAENLIRVITSDNAELEVPAPAVKQFFVQFVESISGRDESPVSAADAYLATEVCLRAAMAADRGRILKLK